VVLPVTVTVEPVRSRVEPWLIVVEVGDDAAACDLQNYFAETIDEDAAVQIRLATTQEQSDSVSASHRREDLAVVRVDQFAHDLIAGLELPRLDLAIVWLIGDLVNVVLNMFGLHRAAHLNLLIKQADKNLRLVAHGRSPLPVPYLNPGPPTVRLSD
jgi:hypothetical protein